MDPVFHLIGLPTDCNSSFERGPALAPPLIRDALWSDRGNTSCENGMEIGCDFQILDKGDLALAEGPDDDDLIRKAVAVTLQEHAIPILLGGDHAVTYPVVQAIHAHYGQVTILHVDAHPDLYHDFEGNPRSHASPFARIMENGLAARLVQVGIRTLNRHCREQAERFGVDIIDMQNFAPGNVPGLSGPVYVSLDLDGLDPAFAPGVSHPEPGGLSVRDVLNVLDRVTGEIVAADIVELNPRFDVNGVTAIVAAKFVREVASRATASRKGMP
ncbi:agmatinase [Aquisediminimonas profunda]|uniref:agmatinase n=1 Tax=Aquisediminimonas profunda TaxID=1550733 RepID=UPI001C62F9B6|nr:agmatinase [Aquisediminimonas profunda]